MKRRKEPYPMPVDPSPEMIRLLKILNLIAPTYIIGRSLICNNSKDVDFMVVSKDKECLWKVGNALRYENFETNQMMSSADSIDFNWQGIVKGKKDTADIDVMHVVKENSIFEIINGFPLTMQHLAYGINGFIFTEYFDTGELHLAPERRQISAQALTHVMKKYCSYYPRHFCSSEFVDMLKQIAFPEEIKDSFVSDNPFIPSDEDIAF